MNAGTVVSERWTRVCEVVRRHGGSPGASVALEADAADALTYATLQAARQAAPEEYGPIRGVYEWQGAPLAALVDGEAVRDPAHLERLRRVVAYRGDVPYLAVVTGEKLDLYVAGLGSDAGTVDGPGSNVAPAAYLPYVASARPGLRAGRTTVGNVVLALLASALDRLVELGLERSDAISLAGRALFARFLADRSLPLGPHLAGRPSADAFADATTAKATSDWLDSNFNGNLLPLSEGLLESLPSGGFGVLVDIMRRAPDGQLSLGWEQKWDNLHFEHIPVGILSQVYEAYLRRHDSERQKKEGSFYTPSFIANLMVRAALAGLPAEQRHAARFLDPAAGAGVFLITAFRHLVAERWRRDGARPDTTVLRHILYEQIAGFDVDEAALRFAALALYLVSIELDPDPEPVYKLGFRDLRGLVLHRPVSTETLSVGRRNPVELDRLGSLGPGVGPEHRQRYDVVIGNPPWKAGTKLPGWRWVVNKVAALAASRIGEPAPAGLLPNEAPDLAFVWRAMEWARPGGQIVFALHGRLLFQQGDGMPVARAALLSALEPTAIVNGAGLRKTRVWPNVAAPFCILFARNRRPSPGAAFRFVTPPAEPTLNAAGLMRIDVAHAPVVTVREVIEEPLRLKMLFRGSELDAEIIERVTRAGHPTLADRVGAVGGVSGSGFQTLKDSSRTRKAMTLPGADAAHLRGLPVLGAASLAPIVDAQDLPKFDHARIHDPRRRAIFRAPLLLVRQSVPTKGGLSAAVASDDVAYTESYYGYSLAGAPDGEALAFLAAAILRSSFASWFMLMTSGKFGFERELVEKASVDRIPIPRLEQADEAQRQTFRRIVEAWRESGTAPQATIDDWVASLLGLDPQDRAVIGDTLARFARAGSPPGTPTSTDAFAGGLLEELEPWTRRFGTRLHTSEIDVALTPGWRFVALTRAGEAKQRAVQMDEGWPGLLHLANDSGCTEIYRQDREDRIWIGMLAQPRLWTYSQGVLAARHVAWRHAAFLAGRGPLEVTTS